VTDICVKLHIINVISVSAAFGFVRRKKCFFRFLQSVILLSKEVALNFVCEIKFLVQKRMLQRAFGEQTLSERNVYKWYKQFKESRERVEDKDAPDDHQPLLMKITSNKSKI